MLKKIVLAAALAASMLSTTFITAQAADSGYTQELRCVNHNTGEGEMSMYYNGNFIGSYTAYFVSCGASQNSI